MLILSVEGHYYLYHYFAEALSRFHEGVEHMSQKSTYPSPEKSYLCNQDNCQGNSLNLPKRYFKVHLQYYHNVDVGFTEEKDLMGCSI